jgi:hypothetical protein
MNLPPAPLDPSFQTNELQAHLTLCEEVLRLVTCEGEALREAGPFDSQDFARQRNALLPRLIQSNASLQRVREAWQRLDPSTRARHTEVDVLLRRNQDLIMKIIVIDRENEQLLLRRGLLPPNRLPSSVGRRPRLAVEHYLKNIPG